MNLEQELEKLTTMIAEPGKNEDGSYTRLPMSEEYSNAASRLQSIMQEEGLNVSIDSVGNVNGFLAGTDPSKGTILTGSHLDTVKNGGLFDGALGIAASLLCVHMLRENHISLTHNLQITGFQGEEGSDLGGTFGSRSMMGLIPSVSAEYEQILRQYGISYRDVLDAAADTALMKCYLELHIEQGKVLEEQNTSIGIVSGIVGITRYKITVLGESNHAGTTPMKLRRDALTAAARLILFINELAGSYPDHLVATVGQLTVSPGAVAVIPGRVDMTLEVRHMNQEVIDLFMDKVIAFASNISEADFSFSELIKKPSVYCSEALKSKIRFSCKQLDLSCTELPSGAGHDGNAIGQRMPIGMIFVPSVKGLSHCKEEWTEWKDAVNGALVLYNTILEIDGEDFI